MKFILQFSIDFSYSNPRFSNSSCPNQFLVEEEQELLTLNLLRDQNLKLPFPLLLFLSPLSLSPLFFLSAWRVCVREKNQTPTPLYK